MLGMRFKSAIFRMQWSRAWRAGGPGVKAAAGVFSILVVPPFFVWFGREFFAPWAYYPVGLSLDASALLVAACLAIPFTIIMARAALEGSRGSDVFIFLISLFMAYGGAAGAMTILNGALDSSPPQSRSVDVLARSPWTKIYLRYFRVASWRPGERDEKVWVDFDVYRSFPARVTVTTRRGALGFEWVASVTPESAATSAPE